MEKEKEASCTLQRHLGHEAGQPQRNISKILNFIKVLLKL